MNRKALKRQRRYKIKAYCEGYPFVWFLSVISWFWSCWALNVNQSPVSCFIMKNSCLHFSHLPSVSVWFSVLPHQVICSVLFCPSLLLPGFCHVSVHLLDILSYSHPLLHLRSYTTQTCSA